jgi:hypothetical protein
MQALTPVAPSRASDALASLVDRARQDPHLARSVLGAALAWYEEPAARAQLAGALQPHGTVHGTAEQVTAWVFAVAEQDGRAADALARQIEAHRAADAAEEQLLAALARNGSPSAGAPLVPAAPPTPAPAAEPAEPEWASWLRELAAKDPAVEPAIVAFGQAWIAEQHAQAQLHAAYGRYGTAPADQAERAAWIGAVAQRDPHACAAMLAYAEAHRAARAVGADFERVLSRHRAPAPAAPAAVEPGPRSDDAHASPAVPPATEATPSAPRRVEPPRDVIAALRARLAQMMAQCHGDPRVARAIVGWINAVQAHGAAKAQLAAVLAPHGPSPEDPGARRAWCVALAARDATVRDAMDGEAQAAEAANAAAQAVRDAFAPYAVPGPAHGAAEPPPRASEPPGTDDAPRSGVRERGTSEPSGGVATATALTARADFEQARERVTRALADRLAADGIVPAALPAPHERDGEPAGRAPDPDLLLDVAPDVRALAARDALIGRALGDLHAARAAQLDAERTAADVLARHGPPPDDVPSDEWVAQLGRRDAATADALRACALAAQAVADAEAELGRTLATRAPPPTVRAPTLDGPGSRASTEAVGRLTVAQLGAERDLAERDPRVAEALAVHFHAIEQEQRAAAQLGAVLDRHGPWPADHGERTERLRALATEQPELADALRVALAAAEHARGTETQLAALLGPMPARPGTGMPVAA